MNNPNHSRTLAARLCAAGLLLAGAGSALAAVRYVDVNSASSAPPYTSWATAATNIQDAVDAAVAGDEIVVTNGIYATGGRVTTGSDGSTTNRVVVDKALSLRSINGPQSTTIDGGYSVRCVYLTNGASLSGFTLTNGVARQGAGLWCESTNAVVFNCVVSGNSAFVQTNGCCVNRAFAGGVYGGTLNNCILSNNWAQSYTYCGPSCDTETCRPVSGFFDCYYFPGLGGAAANATLNNCTLTGNSAGYGGGTYGCALNNCTLTGDLANRGGGASGCTLNNCTLTGNTAVSGGGAADCTLNNSALTGNHASGYGGGAYGGTLDNCTLNGNSAASGGGASAYYVSDGDGGGYRVPVTLNNCRLIGNSAGNGGGAAGGTLNNCVLSSNVAEQGGGASHGLGPSLVFSATLNNCTLIGNSATNRGGGAWDSRLNNCIVYLNAAPQDANYDSDFSTLNYSCTMPQPTNGIGNITNAPLFVNPAAGNYRLRPDSPCIDAGTNLSASITNDLDGRPRPMDGNGDGLAVFDMGAYEYRTPLLVWQDSPNPAPPHADWATAAHTIQEAVDAAVAGDEIVVTNGIYATGERAGNRVAVDKPVSVRSGNGSQFTTIDGAVGRSVYLANGATLSGFTLTNGFAEGSGGGVLCESQTAVVSNCVVSGNWAGTEDLGVNAMGGGVYGGTLNNCTLSGNGAAYGGGAAYGTLNNCTLIGNSASSPFSVGGGAYASTLNNCVVYFNKRGDLLPPLAANYHSCTLNYSCTTPLPPYGVGNITNAPLFVDQAGGNLRLQTNSPCINAGLNAFAPAGPDLDGNPRIKGGTVDIGAYEFQSPASMISYAWLQQYALPTDGSADTTDPDGDGLKNWQEWRCGTDPTNTLSALRLLVPVTGGTHVAVTWQSIARVNYFLERGSSLSAPTAFTPLATNLPGQPGTTTYTDTNAVGNGPFFYRVGVQ